MEVLEAIEVAEAAKVNEAVKVSKAMKITIKFFRVLGSNDSKKIFTLSNKRKMFVESYNIRLNIGTLSVGGC